MPQMMPRCVLGAAAALALWLAPAMSKVQRTSFLTTGRTP
jgi:hypothetical protein